MDVIEAGQWALIEVFSDSDNPGNETVVFRMEKWPADSALVQIARSACCREVTFAVLDTSAHSIEMRWFLDGVEVPLCGHAALATAKLFQDCYQAGSPIPVTNKGNKLYLLDGTLVLSRNKITEFNSDIDIGISYSSAYANFRDTIFMVNSEDELSLFQADSRLTNVKTIGCLLIAPKSDSSVAVRFFVPKFDLFEDSVSVSIAPTVASILKIDRGEFDIYQGKKENYRKIHVKVNNGNAIIDGPAKIKQQGSGIFEQQSCQPHY